MKEQLTLEMLCGYLPYGLKIQWNDTKKIMGITFETQNYYSQNVYPMATINYLLEQNIELGFKPIFRNLQTDLTKEIEHEGERFIPLRKLFETAYPMVFVKKKEWEISVSENNFATIKSKQNYISFQVDLEDAEMVVFNNDGEDMEQINDRYKLYQLLHSWHFWLGDQSYFEKNIILDFNNVNK